MVRMSDVARAAGVSISTVSHVVNDTRRVAPETRRAVLAAIERTGYSPNTIARALATGGTTSIGVAISAVSNPYFGDLVHAIELEASRAGYTLLFGDTHDEPDQELRIVHALRQRRVDGMLVAPTGGSDGAALRYLAAQSIPVVLIDRLASAAFDQVGAESEEPMAGLVGHLAGLGHTRIAMVAGRDGLTTSVERLRGYRLGLARHDLPYRPELVVGGRSEIEPARLAARGLLRLADPPTAIVVGNNSMTIGTMYALREAGLRVPDDVALVAFDDFEWAELFSPRLTTLAQPLHAIGANAVRLLLGRLADPSVPPRTVRLPPELRHRDSCGCRR